MICFAFVQVVILFSIFSNGIAAGEGTCDKTEDGSCVATPTKTKPHDHQVLQDLFDKIGNSATMIDWGNEDPCAGVSTTPNAAGFAFWKGVACKPCDEDPTLFCVRSLWLHQKNLKVGPLPESFFGLTDLEVLKLSSNNITAIPKGTLSSFPKLRYLDLSHNNMAGTLPLSELADLPDLRTALFDNNCWDAIDSPAPPFNGGFQNLKVLDINYNRNLTSPFPAALAYMPQLEVLKIHDTAIYGPYPTDERAFFNSEMLLFSGSSVCGPLPPVCTKILPGKIRPSFCDGHATECKPDDTRVPPIRFGAPKRNYGLAVLEVYKQVMEQVGLEFEFVTDKKHRDLYPLFIETPRTRDTVDIIATSDLPFNHKKFLKGGFDQFLVVGTSYDSQLISFVVPDTAEAKNLHQLSVAAKQYKEKTIHTFNIDDCPVCEDDANEWAAKYFPGFNVETHEKDKLEELVKQKQSENDDELIVVSWIPHGFNRECNLKSIHMQELELQFMNQGKVLIRKDAISKLGKKGMALLNSIMVPTTDVEDMDFKSSYGGMTRADVASEWIRQHKPTVDMWNW